MTQRSCPDLEELSRLVDQELEEPRFSELREHARECHRCGELVHVVSMSTAQLQMARASLPVESASCPRDETLAGYLERALPEAERERAEGHFAVCDHCIRRIVVAHERLHAMATASGPLPEVLRATARVSGEEAAPGREPQAGRWWSRLAEWVSSATRLPIFVPASFALGALLMVGIRELWIAPKHGDVLSRSVPVSQELSIAAGEAVVRTEPSGRAPVLTTLRRGMRVRIVDEEKGWYEVVLSDQRTGWIDHEAFEPRR